MQAYPYNFRQGKTWLSEGFATFKKAPFTWASAMAAYLLIMLAAFALMPGIFKILLLFPLNVCFSVSFLMMAQRIQTEHFISLPLLFSGFTRQLKSLILIGLFEGGIIFFLTLTWFLLDPAFFEKVALYGQTRNPKILENTSALSPLIFLAIVSLIKFVFMYAPALAAFYDVSPFKSIVFSIIATLRNIKPWFVFFVILMVNIFVFCLILKLIASVAPNFGYFIEQILMLCTVCILSPIIYASIYKSFTDVFKINADLPTVA